MPTLLSEIATALRTTEANAIKRAHFLKLGDVCGRCGGSGQYSFNQVDGSTCYGCAGVGRLKPAATASTLERAREAVASGRLDDYLATIEASRRAKLASAQLFAAWGDTRVSRIFNGFGSHTYRDHEIPGNAAAVRAGNNAMYVAVTAALEACRNLQFAKRSNPDYDKLAATAAAAIDHALEVIATHDVEPSPELIEWAQEKQRAALGRVQARGHKPGFEVYA